MGLFFKNHGTVAACVRKLRTEFGARETPSAPYVGNVVKKVKETVTRIDKPKREKSKTQCTLENIAAVTKRVREVPPISTNSSPQQLKSPKSLK